MSLTGPERLFDNRSDMQTVHEIGASDVKGIVEQLRLAVSDLHPGALTAEEAAQLVEAFAEGERLCTAGKAIAARVVERSGR